MKSISEQRYNGLVDQIDHYLGMHDSGIKFSRAQMMHIIELRDTIVVWGERAKKWVAVCNGIIKNGRV